MSIQKKNIKNIILLVPFLLFLVSGASFLTVNLIPTLFPELTISTDSNFWPAMLTIFRTIAGSLFLILSPGLSTLYLIHISKTLKTLFLHKDADLHFKTIKMYIFMPMSILCIYFTSAAYYMNLTFQTHALILCASSILFTLFIYNVQWKKSRPIYVTHKTFFLKKGIHVFFIVNIFYLFLSISLLGLSKIISKYAPLLFKASIHQQSISFLLLLLLFVLPSIFLIVAFTRKSKDTKGWFIVSIIQLISISFIYLDWFNPLLKPTLKEHHFAFFNDITYYFDKPSCLILEKNGISLSWLGKKLCSIDEDFETTSAIGKYLVLTFKNNQRITLPKPLYSSQKITAPDK